MIETECAELIRLRESEERFRTAADDSPAFLWMSDEHGSIIFANRRYKTFFGVETDELLGDGWRRIVHPDDVDAFHADFNAAFAARQPIHRTVRVIHPDLGVRWLDCSGGPRTSSGRFLGYVGLNIDITDRVLAEQALSATERRLDAVLNNASVAIFLMDDRQHCIYMNAAAERLTGYRLEETQGRPLHDVVHHTRPDGSPFPLEECAIDRAFPENNNTQGEEVFVHKDGRFYPVAFTASPVRDEASRTVGTIIEVRDTSVEKAQQTELREETRRLETLNRIGAALASELDLERLVQMVTDAGVELTGARFGAFFHNVLNDAGERLMLYTLSGAERSAFEGFGMPRPTDVFGPTFRNEGVVRSDDILADPRYGRHAPHNGMPSGHLPVRSYLAVPVVSRSGEVIGGLFFGHPEPGRFTERHERLMTGIAAQAAVAIDNARLFQAAQREIEQRRRAEEHQRLLIDELNHRVKNTLAIVQGLTQQTFRGAMMPADTRQAFEGRLAALAAAHNVLTRESWEAASLHEIVEAAIMPFDARLEHCTIDGPELRLAPKMAVTFALGLHELCTNAFKYGSLSVTEGQVDVRWQVETARLKLIWQERGGPAVKAPSARGFGTRMIERGLAAELGGEVRIEFHPAGVTCTIDAPLP